MRKLPIPKGATFGRLTVLSDAPLRQNRSYWLCQCQCGKTVEVMAKYLKIGHTRSCGCLQRDVCSATHRTHGLSGSSIDNRFWMMLKRCYNKSDKGYRRYGGRGIVVCEFLRSSPANLAQIMGDAPSSKHTIGRQHNDGNYSCGQCAECLENNWLRNVEWETPKQQARNRSTNRMFTFDGQTKTIAEWSEITGIISDTFRYRVLSGLDPFKSHA